LTLNSKTNLGITHQKKITLTGDFRGDFMYGRIFQEIEMMLVL